MEDIAVFQDAVFFSTSAIDKGDFGFVFRDIQEAQNLLNSGPFGYIPFIAVQASVRRIRYIVTERGEGFYFYDDMTHLLLGLPHN